MTGGPAADFLRGGDGADTIDGRAAGDRLDGNGGDDVFLSGTGADGADTHSGGDGIDRLSYETRTLPVAVALDGVTAGGQLGEGDVAGADVENLTGGAAGDSLTGNPLANAITGGAGDDAIASGAGGDALTGDGGADAVTGGDGADTLAGGADPDQLDGGGDGDRLDGGGGGDRLDGGTGPDVLGGGDGRDLADYGARAEDLTVTIDGAAGDGAAGEGDDVQADVEDVRGGGGADTFVGSAAANALEGGSGEDYMDGAAGADALTGGDAGDVVRSRDAEGDEIACGPGPDFVIGDAADRAAAECERVDRGVRQRPVIRDSAIVAPARLPLAMSPAGIRRTVPLLDRVVLPLRSFVDAGAGVVDVTSARDRRRRQTVRLYEGAFELVQTAGRRPVTDVRLRGGEFAACPASTGRGARAAQAGRKRAVRRLWARGRGRFRTRGRFAAAAIRGTRWLTVDRCDGTLVRVAEGRVAVRDLRLRRTVIVRAGRSYLARAR